MSKASHENYYVLLLSRVWFIIKLYKRIIKHDFMKSEKTMCPILFYREVVWFS